MPIASQGLDGNVTVTLGAKGVIELELTSRAASAGAAARAWTSTRATRRAWTAPPGTWCRRSHTLVSADGNTPGDRGLRRPGPPALGGREGDDRRGSAAAGRRRSLKKQLGVAHWIDDVGFGESLERLVSQPTVNIEGLVGGYTGTRRQDDPAAQGGRQARPAAGAGHEGRRGARRTQDAPRQEGLRRHRGEHDRRLRSHAHAARRRRSSGRSSPSTAARASIRSSGRATPARGRATSSRASRCAFRPATSAWATAPARTRPTSTT